MSSWRLHIVFFSILLIGTGIIARLFYIQVLQGGHYAALARGQQASYDDIDPRRGRIFLLDKFVQNEDNLVLAATQKDSFLLYAVPKEIKDLDMAIEKLKSFLPEAELRTKLEKADDPYEPIAQKLTDEEAEAVSAFDIEGIYTRKENLRSYPINDLASHTLGFVGYSGDDRVGQYGVEAFYDDILRGKKGVIKIPFFGLSGEMNDVYTNGRDLILTIDYNIQFMLKEKLKEVRDKFGAEGASAVVMDPETGEIIALAAADSFDPNNYSKAESIDLFLNDAMQKTFEPGSIFKPFTMAAALDTGVVSPITEYIDKGYVIVRDRTIKNANEKVYGKQNMTGVLELSLNTGAVFVEQELGIEKFREYIQRFGFGERTGIDLQGEVSGDIQNLLHTSREVNFATASFGQGLAVTPVQLIAAFSAFANGGKMVQPHVLKAIIEADGEQKKYEPEILGEPISAKTAAQITEMLVSVVENGYSKKARVKGYKVAGKTGTAQVPDKEKGGYSEKTVHSFIGFAPAYDPRFVALIKVDNPKGINFSSDSVAPLFSQIAEYILHYYEIPPDS